MDSSGNQRERFRVGDLELDAGTVTLRRGGEEIALPKLSFDLLLCLARHAPNVLTTDMLMDEVWGEVVVGEETVKQRVKLLRKALGDDGSNPRYIAAVRGRGYRLLPDVSPLDGDAIPPAARPAGLSLRHWLMGFVLVAVAVLGTAIVTRDDSSTTPVAESGQGATGRGLSDNPEAREAYLKGRAAYRRWTPRDNETALAFYTRATRLDPDFALAIAGAANANALRATEFGLGEEWIDEAIVLARRALELEPELPEALKALGICHVYKGRYQTALDYYRNVLRLAPEYDEVLFNIAEIMHMTGRWDEAVNYQLRDARRAKGLARLSVYLRDLGFDERAGYLAQAVEQDLPVSFFTEANRSLHHLLDGEIEKARMAVRRMQRAVPNAPGGWLRAGEIDLFAGDLDSAARNFRSARQAAGPFQDYALLRVAHVLLLAGDEDGAAPLLEQVESSALQAIGEGHESWTHRWHLAVVHALLNDHGTALDWYEQAVDYGRRRYEWDEAEPAFRTIRDEDRFEAALQRQRNLRHEMTEAVERVGPT